MKTKERLVILVTIACTTICCSSALAASVGQTVKFTVNNQSSSTLTYSSYNGSNNPVLSKLISYSNVIAPSSSGNFVVQEIYVQPGLQGAFPSAITYFAGNNCTCQFIVNFNASDGSFKPSWSQGQCLPSYSVKPCKNVHAQGANFIVTD